MAYKGTEKWNFANLIKGQKPEALFRICEIPLLSTLKWQAKCLKTFSVRNCADICESASMAKMATLHTACKDTYKWNFANLKKMPKSWISQDSDTFFKTEKFHL